jgi:hypothetical protein
MLIRVCLRILASSRIPRYDLGRQTLHFLGGSVTGGGDERGATILMHRLDNSGGQKHGWCPMGDQPTYKKQT